MAGPAAVIPEMHTFADLSLRYVDLNRRIKAVSAMFDPRMFAVSVARLVELTREAPDPDPNGPI